MSAAAPAERVHSRARAPSAGHDVEDQRGPAAGHRVVLVVLAWRGHGVDRSAAAPALVALEPELRGAGARERWRSWCSVLAALVLVMLGARDAWCVVLGARARGAAPVGRFVVLVRALYGHRHYADQHLGQRGGALSASARDELRPAGGGESRKPSEASAWMVEESRAGIHPARDGGSLVPTTPKKLRPPRAPSNATDEIARLVHEQESDRRGRTRQRRKHVAFDEAITGRPLHRSVRLGGDELREHVVWLARHELKNKGLKAPPDMAARSELARSKRLVDHHAARLQHELASAYERARAYAREHLPHAGGVRLAELRAVVDALAAAPLPMAELRAMRAMRARLSGRPQSRFEPLARPHSTPRSSRQEIARLRGPGWTDRTRAWLSLSLGNWPSGVPNNEAIDPLEVLQIERENLKKQR